MKRLTDTSPEAEQVLRSALREMPFARKWQQMGDVYQTARVLHAAQIRREHPNASADDIRASWIRATLGSELGPKFQERRLGRQR